MQFANYEGRIHYIPKAIFYNLQRRYVVLNPEIQMKLEYEEFNIEYQRQREHTLTYQ